MTAELIPDSAIIRDYVCRLCHSYLTIKWSEEEGSFVTCFNCGARDNFIRRSTIEMRQAVERAGRSIMRYHPVWRKLIPQVSIGAERSAHELFDA